MMTISEKLDSMESIIATMIEMQQQQLNALLVMKQALKEVCDVITGKILNLVKPTRDTTGIADDSDFQVVDVKKESSQHFPVLDTDTKKIIRRLTRFSQIVIEK